MLKDIGYRIEYGLVRVAEWLLRLLPLDVAANIVGTVVAWSAPWTSMHARALGNLVAAFPDWTRDRRNQIAREMWRNTGRVIAETMMLDRIAADPSRLEFSGFDRLGQHFRESGAQIGVTLHMGNWEVPGIALGLFGARLAGVYRPLRNPYLDRYLLAKRSPYYPGGMLFKGTKQDTIPAGTAAIAAIRMLREGGHLGVVCDQVDDTCSFTVPFFDHHAKFTPAPALFARQVGARMWVARCLRSGKGSRFRIDVAELPVDRTSDRAADLVKTTAAMAAQFERWIRETPDQWMWWQRRSIAS